MANHEIKQFASGVHNREDNEDTPKDSAKDSLNWVTIDGKIELSRGKVTVGTEGPAGACPAIHVGYKANGTGILWRKVATAIQYFNGITWIDVVTGLGANDVYVLQTTARSQELGHLQEVLGDYLNLLTQIQQVTSSFTPLQTFSADIHSLTRPECISGELPRIPLHFIAATLMCSAMV